MKLSKICKKPELVLVSLDDEETIKEYGEALDFYTWDRQDLPTFMKMASATTGDMTSMIDIITTLVFTEDGKPQFTDGVMPPTSIMMKIIGKISESLGK